MTNNTKIDCNFIVYSKKIKKSLVLDIEHFLLFKSFLKEEVFFYSSYFKIKEITNFAFKKLNNHSNESWAVVDIFLEPTTDMPKEEQGKWEIYNDR